MSIANQSISQLGGPLSVLSLQKRDHIRLGELSRRLVDTPAAGQKAVLLEIYRLAFPHAFAEEAVLWPLIRRVLPDGHEVTLRVEVEHQQINELVTRLDALDPASPAWQPLIDQLVELFRQDVGDEENELLPRLQARTTALQQRLAGIVWEAVRWIAPTRAHPIVARRPPGNLLSALPLALIDRLRDGVDARLYSGGAVPSRRLSALSTGLEQASRAVERLPGMRSGEDLATRVPAKPRSGWAALAMVTIAAGATALAVGKPRHA
jgi:hypothetical protein